MNNSEEIKNVLPEYFSKKYTSKAKMENTVVFGKYRFTVLDERLIRIEYDENEMFEDRPTQSFINRDTPICEFDCVTDNGMLKIKTKYLIISLNESEIPLAGLSVEILNASKRAIWKYGDEIDTLKGTYRTLDGIFDERSISLDDGVCSRNGFSVIDDSNSLVITENGFVELRQEGVRDLYFFGYGHDYIAATKTLYDLTGKAPLLPSYAFGNWWSRFWKYTEKSYKELINRFLKEDLPFSVAIIDMDWHLTSYPEVSWKDLWTGYTWNKRFFPNHKRFIDWLHSKNLHTALNLHPARGIQFFEEMYPQVAEYMGIAPETKMRVDFAPESIKYWNAYFNYIIHPYEKDGVDFWWMDWQQGTNSNLKGLDPLWMLNYMHSLDIQKGENRPMYFSRYSGVGSQRFYVGFSGDTYIKWDAYGFEPYFTSTAANICYPYWSHDIGGFQQGDKDDELYVRWIQFGVFSPICRLHCSNNPFLGKEPWNYGDEARRIVGEYLRLRHRMFPYLYSMNYRTHTESRAICEPLYYNYPESENAYNYNNEYFFGSEMIVCPVTEKIDKISGLAKIKVYLPKGKWTDMTSGTVYSGETELDIYRNLNQIPVFCKSGAIVPFNAYKKGDNTLGAKTDMEIMVFPGASNSFNLYEDEGINNRYSEGHFATTLFKLNYSDYCAEFSIEPTRGDISVIPSIRNYTVNLRAFSFSSKIKVFCNGLEIRCKKSVEDKTNTISVKINGVSVSSSIVVRIENPDGLMYKNENWINCCYDILMSSQSGSNDKQKIFELLNGTDKKKEKIKKLKEFKKVPVALIGAIEEQIKQY